MMSAPTLHLMRGDTDDAVPPVPQRNQPGTLYRFRDPVHDDVITYRYGVPGGGLIVVSVPERGDDDDVAEAICDLVDAVLDCAPVGPTRPARVR